MCVNDYNKKISPEAKTALSILHSSGYEAHLVGGYIRNIIMGIEPDDIDITSSAKPETVKRIFKEYRIIETGLKHGTVTVMIGGVPIEITTFRSDGEYRDNRHPQQVEFCSSLEDDLSRRDFTINALCFDTKQLIDKFGGRSDIENKIIRAIGNPKKRFTEDALRILRALRFASRFGFMIEQNTSNAIHKLKHLILNISAERIFSELKKILCGDYIKEIFIEYFDVFETILPELKGMRGFQQHNFHHKYDIMTHTAVVIASIPNDPILRLSAMFHDCGKVDTFTIDDNGIGHFYGHSSISSAKSKAALTRLKSDTFTLEQIVKLVTLHDTPIEPSKPVIKKKLNKYGEEILRKLILLQRADTLGLADEFHSRTHIFDKIEMIIEEVISENECFSLKDLAVNGNDIIELGISGKSVGIVLNNLLSLVIDGKIANDKNELIKKAKEFINENF